MQLNSTGINKNIIQEKCENNKENDLKQFEIDRKIIKDNSKSKNLCNQLFTNNKEMEDLYLPKIKRNTYFEDSNIVICETSKMRKINIEKVLKMNKTFSNDEQFKVEINSGFKKEQSLNCDPCLIETNATSVSSSDLLSLANLTELSEPSSKLLSGFVSLSEFLDPLSLSCAPVLSSSLNEDLINIEPIKEKEHVLDLYNKTDLNDSCVPMIKPKENLKINQDIKVLPTEECDYVGDLFRTQTLPNGNKDSQIKKFECFIKGLDFIDPDIIYNIHLKEHTKKMAILVKNMSKHTNDNQVWEEFKKLKPVPQIVHEVKQFIEEDRLNFFKSIYEWKYGIDTADQDKIPVKLAANFSDHAETIVVNGENKSGVADVSIKCIKNLAIMKNNIDIQLRSPNPLNNSLQKKTIKKEIRDLIIHYENYIFNARNKLIRRYEYLQKIIDKHIKLKSFKINDINTVKENTTKKKFTKFKNSFINIETETTQQANNNTDDQETVENTQPNAMGFGFLQPSDDKHSYCTSLKSTVFNVDKNRKHLKKGKLFYDSVSNSNSNKDLSLNNENVKTSRKRLHLPEIEEADNSVKFYKLLKDFDADFVNCSSSSVIKNNILFNSTVLNNPDGDYANSNATPDQTEHENVIKETEYSIEDNSDMASTLNNDDIYDLNILFIDNYEDLM